MHVVKSAMNPHKLYANCTPTVRQSMHKLSRFIKIYVKVFLFSKSKKSLNKGFYMEFVELY